MAAERTWMAWWRASLGATAGALAIGRFAPHLINVAPWPYILLSGYASLAVGHPQCARKAERNQPLPHLTLLRSPPTLRDTCYEPMSIPYTPRAPCSTPLTAVQLDERTHQLPLAERKSGPGRPRGRPYRSLTGRNR